MSSITNQQTTPPTQVLQYYLGEIPLTSNYWIFTKADNQYRAFWVDNGKTWYQDITRSYSSGIGYTWDVSPVQPWSNDVLSFEVSEPFYCYSNVNALEPSQRSAVDSVQALALCALCALLSVFLVFKGVFSLWARK